MAEVVYNGLVVTSGRPMAEIEAHLMAEYAEWKTVQIRSVLASTVVTNLVHHRQVLICMSPPVTSAVRLFLYARNNQKGSNQNHRGRQHLSQRYPSQREVAEIGVRHALQTRCLIALRHSKKRTSRRQPCVVNYLAEYMRRPLPTLGSCPQTDPRYSREGCRPTPLILNAHGKSVGLPDNSQCR